MSRITMLLSCLAVVAMGIGLAGCAKDEAPPAEPAPAADASPAADHDDHADHDHGDAEAAGGGEYAEAFAALSEADRAAAAKQKVCPVSDGPLGAMGTPYKVTVKGKDVFLCCQACEGEINANPDKYLAKLGD